MSEGKFYKTRFFNDLAQGSYRSAVIMVPEIIRLTKPASVVDVGSGTGAWLKAFEENGVKDFLGIDGEYVNTDQLLIDKDRFMKYDLKNPLNLDRRYDICVSLEVGEHLPDTSAESFVDSLTRLSDVVVFSAAIPMQLGTHHINEQYPEYWANIFSKKGYVASDCIRPVFWNNENISYWFKQNMIIYVKESSLSRYDEISRYAAVTNKGYLTKLHPGIFEHKRFWRWAHFTVYTFSKLLGLKPR